MEESGDEQWEAEWMRLHSEAPKSQGPRHILQSSAEKQRAGQLRLENQHGAVRIAVTKILLQ